MDPAVAKKLHDAFKEALFDAATQAVMERFSMPRSISTARATLPPTRSWKASSART
jgi:hypothetical protein